ncbi:uncharacterized protein LOC142357030 [Convolutriloba macropyga]|uniref:uncharacterized protein LOC142357030 n=1 Tax=Convolutriloba macropyga TaxID=536237 RepID=UPI003F51FAE2
MSENEVWKTNFIRLVEELQAKEEDIASMEGRRDKLKEGLETAEQIAVETQQDIEEKRKLLKEHQLNIERVRRLNGEQKISREKVAYEIDVLAAKYLNLQDSCKVQYKRLDDLTGDTKLKTEEVKSTEQECEVLKMQIEKVERVCGVLRDKMEKVEESKGQMEVEKRHVREQQLAMEAEQADHNRRLQLGRRDIKKTQVDDRKIKKDKGMEVQRTKDKTLKFDKSELNQKLLQEQIEVHKTQYSVQFQENAKTDKQRLDYMNKAMQFQNGYLKFLEQDKELQDSIVSLQKSLLSDENQEKCLKNMCEAVRNDINLANRTMLEIRTEMAEGKQDMQTKLTEVDQLKSEVERLSGLVRHEEKQAHAVQHFNQVLHDIIQDEQDLNKSIKETCVNQNEDYHRMIRTMGEIQFERMKQEGELQKVVTERNLLDKQIINRDIELKGLYEKLKLQTSVMGKGEKSYAEREAEAEEMKGRVKELIQERNMLRKKGDGAKSIKDQIEATRRELTRSRHACRVLEDEVEIPVNVHRWRALQGSDPSTYALIEKLQGLNQRYLRVCGELGEKQALLHLQEKMYMEMKNAITKQPGPEVSEQLSVYQSVLKEKAKQLKSMREECKMFEKQEEEYKIEIESLVRELQHVKKKFFLQVAIDEKHARMGKKDGIQGAARPRTTTPRELSPRIGSASQKVKTGPNSAKEVKFAEETEGGDPATGTEQPVDDENHDVEVEPTGDDPDICEEPADVDDVNERPEIDVIAEEEDPIAEGSPPIPDDVIAEEPENEDAAGEENLPDVVPEEPTTDENPDQS